MCCSAFLGSSCQSVEQSLNATCQYSFRDLLSQPSLCSYMEPMISRSIAGGVCELQLICRSRHLGHMFSSVQRDSMLSSFPVKSLLLRSFIEWQRVSQMCIYHSLNNSLISSFSFIVACMYVCMYAFMYVQISMS